MQRSENMMTNKGELLKRQEDLLKRQEKEHDEKKDYRGKGKNLNDEKEKQEKLLKLVEEQLKLRFVEEPLKLRLRKLEKKQKKEKN